MTRARAVSLPESDAVEIDAAHPPIAIQRGISLGFLAMLPLFFAYEIAFAATGGTQHNTGEFVLSAPLAVFGGDATLVRRLVLVACAIAAAWRCFHHELNLTARVARVVIEGFAAALVLGPLLLVLQHALQLPEPRAIAGAISSVPSLAHGTLHFAGAAYEEIVFRVGLQSLFYVLCVEVVLFYTESTFAARVFGEGFAIVAGSLVFAAAHLAAFTHVLGPGGEDFDTAIFAWRVLAGCLLGVLFRWRGPGVAAWAHGLFNLALFIGAGPDVFL